MKNFFGAAILIIVLSAIAESFFPWWSITIVAFAVGFAIPLKREASWFAGVFAIFLLWLFYAMFLSYSNHDILAARVAEVLHPITGGKIFRLYFLTAAVGSLTAGFASLSGRLTAMEVRGKA